MPSGSGWCLPASLPPAGDGQVCCQLALLWYSLSPLLCERAQQFLLSLSVLHRHRPPPPAIPQFGLLSQVSSLRLPSGHSGLVLPLSNAACSSLLSPHLLVEDASIWATSLLRVAVKARNLWGLYIYFSSRLCYPLRFKNSPQTCW